MKSYYLAEEEILFVFDQLGIHLIASILGAASGGVDMNYIEILPSRC